MNRFRNAFVTALVVGMILGGAWTSTSGQQGQRQVSNVLLGRVYSPEGNPVGNATVRMYHLGSGKVSSTVTTPETGSFILSDLPDGGFEISVEIKEGHYYAQDLVNLSGGLRAQMSFSLDPGPLPMGLSQRITERGLDVGVALGVVRAVSGGGPGGTSFWSTRKGITTIWLTSIAGGYLLYELIEDDDDGSPFGP